MPELPEVECLSRAVRKILNQSEIVSANFLRPDLRGPIPIKDFEQLVVGQKVLAVSRRSKYMLWETPKGYGIIHLGMTGNIVLRETANPVIPHTHAVFDVMRGQKRVGYLHYIDPRRFGWITCCRKEDLATHPFFEKLGPEPLDCEALNDHLWQASRKKTVAIKNFLMNAHIVVGVGNIYANEALFRAGVRPTRPAGRVTRAEMDRIAVSIQETLQDAIAQGGTTFRDFKNADGNPGYFKLSLNVYGRLDESCNHCGKLIKSLRQMGRATYYCPNCQK